MGMDGVTTTRDLVYEFVVAFRREHGLSPSVREIQRGVGLSSTSVTRNHIQALLEDGRLRQVFPGASRALIPLADGGQQVADGK